MAKILVDKLNPGMILNSDVNDITGRLLLKGGREINEINIKTLKAWGVIEVDIQGIAEEEIIADDIFNTDSNLRNEAEKELGELLSLNDLASPVVKELFRLCLRNKIRMMTGRGCDAR